MNTDPIADLLTRIRNTAITGNTTVTVPYSNQKNEMLKILEKKGYVEKISVSKNGKFREIEVTMPEKKDPLHLKRISKPGQRIYVKRSKIPRVLDGLGIAILSTPKGILDDNEARKQKVGGELLCEIY